MDHEDMEALLAGYALRSLSSEDEAVADRLLAEHVPGCFSCREALEAFQVVASELAVEPAPMDPPETLLPRLRNDLRPGGRRRRVPVLAVAASVAGLIALSGLAVTQGVRLSDARQQTILLSDAVNFAAQPGAKQVPLADRTGAPGPVTAMAHPGVEVCYIVARDLPIPPPGTRYGVWVITGSSAKLVGHFVPREPVTVLRFAVDPSKYDQIVVTQDPPGSISYGDVLWQGSV
jgi:hypothetical protein